MPMLFSDLHSPDVEMLADIQDIYEVVARYCRGVDRLDLDLVRSCYHSDAITNHGSFKGSPDEFLTWVRGVLSRYTSTFHVIGNHLAQVDGNAALSETYAIAFHRGEPQNDRLVNQTTGLRFVDRLERREGCWRLSQRICTVDWNTVTLPKRRFPLREEVRTGARDRSDALYQI